MSPERRSVPAFKIAGISARASNADASSIGKLWEEFFSTGVMQKIPNAIPDSEIFGVYSEYDSDMNGPYTVTAGVKIPANEQATEPFVDVDVAGGEYLVFIGKGPMPQVVVDSWREVWNYFSIDCEMQRTYATDFEIYAGMEEVVIYVGVSGM